MTGNAFRTNVIAMTELGPFVASSQAIVYALSEEWIHDGGVTTFVIVTASHRDYETCIYPCDEEGLVAEWQPIEVFPTVLDHDAALLAVGYRSMSVRAVRHEPA